MRNKPIIFILCLAACRQTYAPPVIANPPNYLVVEGYIEDNGTDSTVFTLSHTVNIDSIAFAPEPGATVTVEGSDNSAHPLGETGNGNYGALLTTLNNNVTYRIHIVTAAGKKYASDYVPLVYNPPIDSISWIRVDNNIHDGVQIYANTHNPLDNTHYYSWKYQECWEFHSPFESAYRGTPTGVTMQVPIIDYVCWRYNTSSNILLASSTQLSHDVIYESPLVFIPSTSQEITVRYSILVTQHALTENAFKWWQILQKNTEQLGSLFGVQPSANPGNIHCLTDTAEQVLGYVDGGNSRSQRIFITNDQVLPWFYNSGCVEESSAKFSIYDLWTRGFLPIGIDHDGTITFSDRKCIDCTLTGTNVRPNFW
jgi:hypothetical protein